MKLIGSIILTGLLLSAVAHAQNVESAPLVPSPPKDGKHALFITTYPAGVFGCPDGFSLYVERVKPAESKDPADSFKGFFYIGTPVANNPNIGFATSRPGNELVGACFKTK